MDEQLKPYESLQCWDETLWQIWHDDVLLVEIYCDQLLGGKLADAQVPTWKKSDFRHTTRLDRPLPGWGWGGGVQLYKIGFLQIPDASNKCSATKQKLVNFPWKRLPERCVRARVPRFHNFSGVGDKNWVQLRSLEHNLIFIEDLGWIGQLDVKSWDRTGMTIHQLSIFQPRSHAACKRVSKINKYGQFHDCRYLWWEVSELEFCSRDGYLSPVQISPS